MHRNRLQLVVLTELDGNKKMSSLRNDDDDDDVEKCSRYRYNL